MEAQPLSAADVAAVTDRRDAYGYGVASGVVALGFGLSFYLLFLALVVTAGAEMAMD